MKLFKFAKIICSELGSFTFRAFSSEFKARRGLFAILAGAILGSAGGMSGCAGAGQGAEEEGEWNEITLNFPTAAGNKPVLQGTYHGVSILLEQEEKGDAAPVFPRRVGLREVYSFDDHVTVQYQQAFFFVDSWRFPAEPNSYLHIFKEQSGPWTFSYRGQAITLETPNLLERQAQPWRPVVYRRILEMTDASAGAVNPVRTRARKNYRETRSQRTSRVEFEEIRFFTSTLIFRPDVPYWDLNGQKFYPQREKTLVIDRQRNFKLVDPNN